MSKLRIGTSGWTYKGWRGPFYPDELSMKQWLRWYATQFSTTEINGSFYRTPSIEAVKAWRDQTPDDFVFAWKASKFITHWKRLTEKCRNSLELLETRLKRTRAQSGAHPVSASATIQGKPGAIGFVPQAAQQEAAVRLRVSRSELV